jgi:hypothetical protein
MSCPPSPASRRAPAGRWLLQNAPEQTLIESWNGTSWSSRPVDIGTRKNTLSGVSCVSATSCMADGFYRRGSDRGDITNRTLIEFSA